MKNKKEISNFEVAIFRGVFFIIIVAFLISLVYHLIENYLPGIIGSGICVISMLAIYLYFNSMIRKKQHKR